MKSSARARKQLFDQIFELKYLMKQLNQHAKKCEAEEKVQKKKATAALEKNNMEIARTYASNAIRKKNEAINYVQLASRLDAVIARLDQQSTLTQVDASASGITKSINKLLSKVSSNKMASNMKEFSLAMGELDVATSTMEKAIGEQAASLHDEEGVNLLLEQLEDEHGMNLKQQFPQNRMGTVDVVRNQADGTKEQGEDFLAQLNAMRN
jgi:charged multivesicular body protein 1